VPYAFVVANPGAQLDEKTLHDHAPRLGPAYQYLRRVVVLDALPLAGTNKIDRQELSVRAREIARTTTAAAISDNTPSPGS